MMERVYPLRLDAETLDALAAIAADQERGRADVLRRLIRAEAKRLAERQTATPEN